MLVETAGAFAHLPVTSKDDDYGKEDNDPVIREEASPKAVGKKRISSTHSFFIF
jgi:hypothetical protein